MPLGASTTASDILAPARDVHCLATVASIAHCAKDDKHVDNHN